MSFVNKRKAKTCTSGTTDIDFCPEWSGKVSPLLGSTEGDESSPDGAMTRSPQGKFKGKTRWAAVSQMNCWDLSQNVVTVTLVEQKRDQRNNYFYFFYKKQKKAPQDSMDLV